MRKENESSSKTIEAFLKDLDSQPSDPEVDSYYHDRIYSILKEEHKREIIKSSLIKYYQAEELKPYQAELIKMQQYLEESGTRMIILFEGRDAAGKGGTIRRVTRYMNEKHYRIVAMGNRCPPDHHNFVSHEFVDRPFVTEHDRHYDFEVFVEHLKNFVGRRPLTH